MELLRTCISKQADAECIPVLCVGVNLKNLQSLSNLKNLCRIDILTPNCKLSNMNFVVHELCEA